MNPPGSPCHVRPRGPRGRKRLRGEAGGCEHGEETEPEPEIPGGGGGGGSSEDSLPQQNALPNAWIYDNLISEK